MFCYNIPNMQRHYNTGKFNQMVQKIEKEEEHSDSFYKEMEDETLRRINELGIGVQGLRGPTTALKVNIETYPTHIAGLPVAVNISCHVTRHKTATIFTKGDIVYED